MFTLASLLLFPFLAIGRYFKTAFLATNFVFIPSNPSLLEIMKIFTSAMLFSHIFLRIFFFQQHHWSVRCNHVKRFYKILLKLVWFLSKAIFDDCNCPCSADIFLIHIFESSIHRSSAPRITIKRLAIGHRQWPTKHVNWLALCRTVNECPISDGPSQSTVNDSVQRIPPETKADVVVNDKMRGEKKAKQ